MEESGVEWSGVEWRRGGSIRIRDILPYSTRAVRVLYNGRIETKVE